MNFFVLRSSRYEKGYHPTELKVGDFDGETGWLSNSDPTGGRAQDLGTFGAVDFGVNQVNTYETPAILLSANALALHYLDSGGPGDSPEGIIAGLVIVAIPEPSSLLLSFCGVAGLWIRSRS